MMLSKLDFFSRMGNSNRNPNPNPNPKPNPNPNPNPNPSPNSDSNLDPNPNPVTLTLTLTTLTLTLTLTTLTLTLTLTPRQLTAPLTWQGDMRALVKSILNESTPAFNNYASYIDTGANHCIIPGYHPNPNPNV